MYFEHEIEILLQIFLKIKWLFKSFKSAEIKNPEARKSVIWTSI